MWEENDLPEKVKNVVSAIIANDTLALNTRAKLHLFSLVIHNLNGETMSIISLLLARYVYFTSPPPIVDGGVGVLDWVEKILLSLGDINHFDIFFNIFFEF